jgi:uncharacterized protein YkwD
MSKSIATTGAAAIAALSFALPTSAAQAATPSKQARTATVASAAGSGEVATMARMINRTRRRAGRRPLRMNGALNRAAQLKLAKIGACGDFSHTPCGTSFTSTFRAAGWRRATMGENIAWGTSYLAAAPAILRSWMHSPGHKANVLRRSFRYQGLAVGTVTLAGVGPVRVWVNTFGR